MLEVFEPGALNYSTFFRPIVSTLCAFRNPILTPLPLSGFSALRSDRTHSRSGILSSDTTHASGGVVIFVRQGLPFLNFLPPLFLRLIPTLIMSGSTSLLTTPPRSLFSMCTPILFSPPQRMAEPIPFLPPSFPPPEISSFWETSIAITPFEVQELLPTPAGRKYSTGSSSLTSSPAMTLTHPPFSIVPLAVTPLLTSPLPSLLLPFLAQGRCYRTLALTTYQFFYLSLSLRSFAPTNAPLPSIFRKLAGMALPLILTLTVLQQRNTRLFLFLCCCSFYLSGTECGQIFHFFRPHQTPS